MRAAEPAVAADVVLAYARNHAAERPGRWADGPLMVGWVDDEHRAPREDEGLLAMIGGSSRRGLRSHAVRGKRCWDPPAGFRTMCNWGQTRAVAGQLGGGAKSSAPVVDVSKRRSDDGREDLLNGPPISARIRKSCRTRCHPGSTMEGLRSFAQDRRSVSRTAWASCPTRRCIGRRGAATHGRWSIGGRDAAGCARGSSRPWSCRPSLTVAAERQGRWAAGRREANV
jgi:hypothetical protein